MTIIQPNINNPWLNRILFALTAMLMLTACWLVVLYVQMVNLNHSVEDISVQIQKTQTANAELKDSIFSLFDGASLDTLAQSRQLVQDKNPKYLEVSKWSNDYQF